MGTLYTSQAAAGYNSSPPPDDGSQGANNQITWGTTIKAKLADPIKALADAINSQLTTALDLSPRAISTPDSAVASDHWRTLEVTGTTTITLSDAATMTKKYVVGIANLGVGTVTVTRATGANTVNGVAADFTIPPKSAVVLGVNNAATGYNIISSTGGNSNNTSLVATTSVVTPMVGTTTATTVGFQYAGSQVWNYSNTLLTPIVDNTMGLGGPSNRWANVMTPIIDSGTAGSLSLKTNNGATQVSILNSTGADFWELTGGASGGNAVRMQTNGSDTNVTAQYSTKGSGGHDFLTNSAAPETQFQVLRTASATRNITVTGSNGGNPTISTTAGNLAVGTVLDLGSTGQLQFPATQNPSAGVNVLDDYEEGAWTPSLGGSATYTLQNGEYTKVGRLVFFRGSLTVNAIGTGSVSQISGLPFTNGIAQNAACYFTGIANSATSLVSLSGRINASATTIDLLIRAAANASETVGGTIFQAGTAVIVSGCYESA